MARIDLTEAQEQTLESFLEGRTQLIAEEVLPFLEENDFPWDNVPAFRIWLVANDRWERSGSSGKGMNPTTKGLTKFNAATGATSIAALLLQDPAQAITGAIKSLEEELSDINLESENQINKVRAAAEEAIGSRKELIKQLQAQLPIR